MYVSLTVLQAVYGAFARFRARHCLGSSNQHRPSTDNSSPTDEGEASAIGMLQHVSSTAAATSSDTDGGADSMTGLHEARPSGLKSIPSQQSDLPSLASAEAEQGSADRWVNLSIEQYNRLRFYMIKNSLPKNQLHLADVIIATRLPV